MEQQEIQFSHYLKLLWKGKWLILLTTLVALAGVLIFIGAQPPATPSYFATATVKVDQAGVPSALANLPSLPTADRSLNTQIQLISSRNIMERALARLQPKDAEESPDVEAVKVLELQRTINVQAVANTNLLEVRARAASPELAQAKANAVVEAYIDYVKEERTRAIQDAVNDITEQLQTEEEPNGTESQLKALLPTMGTELASSARLVNRSQQMVTELESQGNPEGLGVYLNRELPKIKWEATQLNNISQDLQKIQNDLSGEQEAPAIEGGDILSIESAVVEKAANDLDSLSGQLQEIRTNVQTLEPSRALERAAGRAVDAQAVLERVPAELSGIQTNDIAVSRQVFDIGNYAKSVAEEMGKLSEQFQTEAASGSGLTQNQRILLRGKLLAHSLGLTEAANDLKTLRGPADAQDISRISAAEGNIRTAINQIDLIITEVNSTVNVTVLNASITEVIDWVNESGEGLRMVSENFLNVGSQPDPQEERNIAAKAGSELEDIALTLGVAAGRLSDTGSAVPDSLLRARINSVAQRLTSSQNEVQGSSDRLTAIIQGRLLASPDSLAMIQDRVQQGTDTMWAIAGSIQPGDSGPAEGLNADSVANAYSATLNVVQDLDIAHRQLQALARGISDPLLGGEIASLTDRLLRSHSNVKGISDRLANIASTSGAGGPAEGLVLAKEQLKVAAVTLETAADTAQGDLSGAEGELVQDTATKVREQADTGAAILGMATSELKAIQGSALPPSAYGQLVVLMEQIGAAQTQAKNVSDHLRQLQAGKGPGIFELQQLKAELELSLLQPQDTGITMVDSAVSLRADSGGSSFFSRVRVPLAGMAGFFLGCMAVLAKAQVNQTVTSPTQLRDRLGLATLGVIPKVKTRRSSPMLKISEHNLTAFSEALQLIGVNLTIPINNGLRSLVITSSTPKEGKTMLAVNLAQVLAQYGHKVILVDGNLRKPEVAKYLDIPEDEGLVTALTQQTSPLDYVVDVGAFSVLQGGTPPDNPVELLSSPAMSFFLEQAQRKYDVVLIDSPPVSGFAETKAMAKSVSGAVLVIKAGTTGFELVKESKEDLDTVGISIVGTVLNYSSDEECAHLKHHKYGPSPTNGNGKLAGTNGWSSWQEIARGRKVTKNGN